MIFIGALFLFNLCFDNRGKRVIQDVNKVLPTSLLLQREFETSYLHAINLMRFDGDSKQWPNFIQNFKHRVCNKISFSDSVCMDCLLSVVDGLKREP